MAILKKENKKNLSAIFANIISFLVIQCVFGEHLSIDVVLGNVFCIGDFLGIRNQFNWYLGAQLIFYLLFPYLVGFVIENKDSKNKLLFMFVALILISVLLRGGYYIYMSSRLPTAYLGIVSVILFKDTNEVKNKLLLFIALSFVVGTSILLSSYIYFPEGLIIYGLNWYPFILMTPFMCYVISSIAEKFKIFRKLFDYIGKMSLELYLTHIMLFELISKLRERYQFLDGYKYRLRLLAILVSFVTSIVILKIKKRRIAQ